MIKLAPLFVLNGTYSNRGAYCIELPTYLGALIPQGS